MPGGKGQFFSIERKAHSPSVWKAGESWPSARQGQPDLSVMAAFVYEQSLDLGLLEGESHFGHGCLEEMDSSFPFEAKPRAPVFQGYIRRDPRHDKGSWSSQTKPTRPVTCSLVSMGPCSVTMVVSSWILGSMRPSWVTLDSCFHGAPQCHTGPLFPCSLAVSQGSLPAVSQWTLCSEGTRNGRRVSLVP